MKHNMLPIISTLQMFVSVLMRWAGKTTNRKIIFIVEIEVLVKRRFCDAADAAVYENILRQNYSVVANHVKYYYVA